MLLLDWIPSKTQRLWIGRICILAGVFSLGSGIQGALCLMAVGLLIGWAGLPAKHANSSQTRRVPEKRLQEISGLAGIHLRACNFIIDMGLIFWLYLIGYMTDFSVAHRGALTSIAFLYFVVYEAKYSKTLGKYLTGTKVVNRDGTPVTKWRLLFRTLLRFIPFEFISFLFFRRVHRPVFLHDMGSNTLVIIDRPGPLTIWRCILLGIAVTIGLTGIIGRIVVAYLPMLSAPQ